MARKILHLDLDAFYPSVEALDDPAVLGKPVIVGGLGPRGVVASASYEARRLGVHSAMPMARARRLCTGGVFLPPRFARYRELSGQVFSVYTQWTEMVEPLSLDEAYLDVSTRGESGEAIARRIKEQVRLATGLTVSAGVAGNKFLAKLASAMRKPDGLTVIEDDQARQFIAPLPVDQLWGVGPATAAKLREAGFETIAAVAAASPQRLAALLGRHGQALAAMARGEDDRPVERPGRPRSISAETTFDSDLRTWEDLAPHVRRFVTRVGDALAQQRLVARTAILKLRFADFRTVTRSFTPGVPLLRHDDLLVVARELARRVGRQPPRPVRLIGFGVANLVANDEERHDARARQPGLFDGGQD